VPNSITHYMDTGYGHVVQHQQRTSSQQFYNLLYNKFITNGQKFATSQHLDMSRCWALALRCGKFVVQQVGEFLWACPLVVLHTTRFKSSFINYAVDHYAWCQYDLVFLFYYALCLLCILYFVLSICICFYIIQPIGCNINNKLSSVQYNMSVAGVRVVEFGTNMAFLAFLF